MTRSNWWRVNDSRLGMSDVVIRAQSPREEVSKSTTTYSVGVDNPDNPRRQVSGLRDYLFCGGSLLTLTSIA